MYTTEKPDLASLTHYGVLGMKWGVRKDTTAKSTKKKQEKNKPFLSPKQKGVLILGATVAAAALAAYGVYKLNESGVFDNFIGAGKNALDAKFDPETGLKLLDNQKNAPELIFKVNPKRFNPLEVGATMNCGNCGIAYELRKRGFDVQATLNKDGIRQEILGSYFNGMHVDSIKSFKPDLGLNLPRAERGKEILRRTNQFVSDNFPDGARGMVTLPMNLANHFITWSKKGSEVIFENPQNPSLDLSLLWPEVNSKTYGGKLYDGLRFTRLDDLSINPDSIRQMVQSNGGDLYTKITDVFDSDIIPGPGFVMKV